MKVFKVNVARADEAKKAIVEFVNGEGVAVGIPWWSFESLETLDEHESVSTILVEFTHYRVKIEGQHLYELANALDEKRAWEVSHSGYNGGHDFVGNIEIEEKE